MRVLVWQWGRRGAGPRFAAQLAKSLNELHGVDALLSLSDRAEIMHAAQVPTCDLPFATYNGLLEFGKRAASARMLTSHLAAQLTLMRLDGAICAMIGPLDFIMAAALRRIGLSFTVIVHDADTHPGDGLPMQLTLQRHLIRRADATVTMTRHVAERLIIRGLITENRLVVSNHPPFIFGPLPPPPRKHGGKLHLLFFGRLLAYKGLDLLAAALRRLGPGRNLEVRVVGFGPECRSLHDLRKLHFVNVENRWVAEDEIAELLAWSDAVVLPYRQASQSGVAAAALAAGRWILATRVGGLSEQLAGEPMALLCEPRADSLEQAIIRLLDLPTPEIKNDPALRWREFAANVTGLWRDPAG